MSASVRFTGSLPALLAVGLLAGCAVKPGGATCRTATDCPSGSSCQAGICQVGLALDFRSPAAGRSFASDALPVEVTVAGTPPEAVQLVVDDGTAATLAPPFAGTLDTSALAEGTHQLVAVAEIGGRTYRTPLRTLEIDRTAPAAPVVAAATTGAADPVTVTGTLTPDGGAPVTVTVSEGGTVLASGVVPTGSAWSVAIPLAEGAHALSAVATDAAGNGSVPSSPAPVVVDRTAPPAPTVTAATTSATDPVPVTGTVPADGGSPLTISVFEGATEKAAGIVPVNGAWSAAFPLSEGSHGLTARAIDAARNVSALSAVAAVVVDRSRPPPPTVTSAYTAAASPVPVSGTWSGGAASGATIAVFEGTTPLVDGIVPANGAWSAALKLGEGRHALTAVATSAAGITSTGSVEGVVFVDRAAPAAPSVTALTTGATPVPLSGRWTPDAGAPVTLTLFDGGSPLPFPVATSPDGTWSASVTLAEGSHTVTAQAVDAARNASPASSPATVVVDRTAPPVPSVTSKITREVNPVPVAGTVPADAGTPLTLEVYDGTTQVAAGIVPSGGTWTAPLTLADGTHTLRARAVDAATNPSALSAPAAVVVDRAAPAVPSVSPRKTNAASPVTVSGTSTPDLGTAITIEVYEGTTAPILLTQVTPGAGGAWSVALDLAPGSHPLSARAVDAAGNASARSATALVEIDRTPPSITAQLPAPNATNVWTRDPIVVTFSEPMDRGRLSDTSVTLVTSAGTALVRNADLSTDGRTLTVTTPVNPPVPDTFTLSLVGLADLAGNALPPTSWSWTAPEWQALGAGATVPSSSGRFGIEMTALAVRPNGQPVVAMQWAGTNGAGFVAAEYTGDLAQPWRTLPSPVLNGRALTGSLAADGHDVFAAFGTLADGTTVDSSRNDVWAGRFDGTTWTATGLMDLGAASDARTPSIALDDVGAPYVSWVEPVGTVDAVFARRWSGSSWTRLGTGSLSATTFPASAPAAQPGRLAVTWTTTEAASDRRAATSAWSGSAWVPAHADTYGFPPTATVSVNGKDVPYLLEVAADGKLEVYRPGPTFWSREGAALNVGTGAPYAPTMAFDPSGAPVVAWYEIPVSSGVNVKRLDSTGVWGSLTKTPFGGAGECRLAVSSRGIIAVAEVWYMDGGRVLVWRYNR